MSINLQCPSAFDPMLTTTIRILVAGRRREDQGDSVLVERAYVVAADPYSNSTGGGAGEVWRVMFKESDWVCSTNPVQGTVIEADLDMSRPKLTVQRMYRLGGLWHLVCSARERGVA